MGFTDDDEYLDDYDGTDVEEEFEDVENDDRETEEDEDTLEELDVDEDGHIARRNRRRPLRGDEDCDEEEYY
jgi:hypothetical protein